MRTWLIGAPLVLAWRAVQRIGELARPSGRGRRSCRWRFAPWRRRWFACWRSIRCCLRGASTVWRSAPLSSASGIRPPTARPRVIFTGRPVPARMASSWSAAGSRRSASITRRSPPRGGAGAALLSGRNPETTDVCASARTSRSAG